MGLCASCDIDTNSNNCSNHHQHYCDTYSNIYDPPIFQSPPTNIVGNISFGDRRDGNNELPPPYNPHTYIYQGMYL